MDRKEIPVCYDVSDVLCEENLYLLLRQCENGVPEIEFLYDNEFDAQAEAAKGTQRRNKERKGKWIKTKR